MTEQSAEDRLLRQLIDTLNDLADRTDTQMDAGSPWDGRLNEIPSPPDEVVARCRQVQNEIRSRGQSAPQLTAFIADPSPFEIRKVLSELRSLERDWESSREQP